MSKNNQVTIPSVFPLSGTLTMPDEVSSYIPAVLIIPGTGMSDRDGNMKNMKMNIYKDLADHLTAKGFATLRYDKRGTYKSGGNFLEAGIYDFIEDATHCVQFLKNHSGIDAEKIFILGHSEGALLAPAVHQKSPVAGLILLGGAARASKDLLPYQTDRAFAEMEQFKGCKGAMVRLLKIPERARRQNQRIFKKISESDKPVMRIQGKKINAKWIRNLFSYDVCEYLQEVTCPVLAITGEKDLQVPPEEVKRTAEMVKGESEWHIIPNMNHILKKYEGQHTMLGLMKEYIKMIDQPMDQELLVKIDQWLEKILNHSDETVIENNHNLLKV